MTIHWCGTGLSSGPGLRALLQRNHDVVVWNRTVAKAQELVGDLTSDVRAYDLDALTEALEPGDIAVSMLPADQHVSVANRCLIRGAHFVSSSYIAPEMRELHDAFVAKGLSSVNEVGLDPGIDHLMAHDLVARYRASLAARDSSEANLGGADVLSFTSYCGGVPKVPNDFKYKFSWAPLGVLKALRSPSRSLLNFDERKVDRPWNAITAYDAPLPTPETFEVYPNRDSYPFMVDYQFDPAWTVRDFVRGTIRLQGWSSAWAPVFAEIETLSGPEGDARLAALSAELLAANSYADGEPDRVVLFVSLRAERDSTVVFDETWSLDAWGDDSGSAMGRLVSMPVTIAIESLLAGEIGPGVHAAPHDPALVSKWLSEIATHAQYMERLSTGLVPGPATGPAAPGPSA
jgi:saccharopine dehydrogenase-like NADP-dependent oxidoreductase